MHGSANGQGLSSASRELGRVGQALTNPHGSGASAGVAVDPVQFSLSAERDHVLRALQTSVEFRSQLTDALMSLFQRIETSGLLTAPLGSLLPNPDPNVKGPATQEPPPMSGQGQHYRGIRDAIADGNGALVDMVGAIMRVRNAIDG